MKANTTFLQMSIRIVGALMLILGGFFWISQNLSLVIIHILIGCVLVLLLWALAYQAARAGVSTAMVVLVVAWSILLPVLGLRQAQLLPCPAHWVIHVVHLMVGIGAIAQAEILSMQIKNRGSRKITKPGAQRARERK